MQKQSMYHDKDYCGMMAMCISYRCQYGLQTFVSDILMAENVMSITDANSSVFIKVNGGCNDNENND